jgi:hypothetical protein
MEARGVADDCRTCLHFTGRAPDGGRRIAAADHRYNRAMADRQCDHRKQRVAPGEAHDCRTTIEAALTRELSDDLRDAWERPRETGA